MLIRCPRCVASTWQVIGGLIGLSLSLALLHGFVLVHAARENAAIAIDIYLIYHLIFPAFVVGSLGAAAGILLALLCRVLCDR